MQRIVFFLAPFAALLACGRTASPDQAVGLPEKAQPDWRRFEGPSFTLRYPSAATLRAATSHPGDLPGTAIVGPTIHVPAPPDQGPSDGPAYQLIVSAFANPLARSAEQWVDSVRRAWNDHPMDSDSLGFLYPPETLTVNGLHALRLKPFCGDCAPEEIYIAGRDQTVVLSYVFDIGFPGDREAQRRLYSAILNTFTWKP